MKHDFLFAGTCSLIFITVVATSCNGQSDSTRRASPPPILELIPKESGQIAQYVVEIFEDKKGNLWFGTIDNGVARFDGKTLSYLSIKDGLCGNTVTTIAEDNAGNLWIGTHSGLSKYDGRAFTNFTRKEGLCDNRVSNILIDRAGVLWVGTWGGVCRFNGTGFTDFPVPIPDIELLPYQTTMNWVTEITEDQHGNIWIGRDGYGACKYDGASFKHFTKKDGLASNNVQAIQADKRGNIWFGSRAAEKDSPDANDRTGAGGLSRYDGQSIIQYPNVKGLGENDIYTIAEDRAGNIWIGANGLGAYRFDGQNFTLFSETDRKDLMPYGYGIQSMLEDRNGTLWFGLSGGLFRLKDAVILNVTQGGPWE